MSTFSRKVRPMVGTNIQTLFEDIVDNNKKIIVFGVGEQLQNCIDRINKYLEILCDTWKTPAYLQDEPTKYPYHFGTCEQYIEFALDNDESKKGRIHNINHYEIPIKSFSEFQDYDASKYVILITTLIYEQEIKEQLKHISKDIEFYGCFSDLHYYSKRSRGLIIDRIILPYLDTIKSYTYWRFPEDEYQKIIQLIEKGEFVTNAIAFEVTTVCNLRCKYCTDYIPVLKNHRHLEVEQVIRDIDTFFSVVGRCLRVQLTSGEVLLCPNLNLVLKKLISMDEVQLIEIVTNGMTYPRDENTLKLLANPKVLISMSNYNCPERTDVSRSFYKRNGIKVRFVDEQYWTIQGLPPYDRKLNKEQLTNHYMDCPMAKVCPQQVSEGKVASCGKIQRFKEVSEFKSSHDFVDLYMYESKEDLRQALIDLKIEPYMDGCGWCDVNFYPKEEDCIMPAEQWERR